MMRRSLPMIDLSPLSVGPVRRCAPLTTAGVAGRGGLGCTSVLGWADGLRVNMWTPRSKIMARDQQPEMVKLCRLRAIGYRQPLRVGVTTKREPAAPRRATPGEAERRATQIRLRPEGRRAVPRARPRWSR